MKSSIALYQALKSINVSDEHAKSVADALEADMETHLATKADIKELELATKADIKALALDTKARFDLLDVQLQYLVQIMKWGMGDLTQQLWTRV